MTATDLGPGFGPGGVGADLFRANPQAQQFIALLHGLYKSRTQLYDPDAALLEDPNFWTKILRDDRMRAAISMRLAKVARLSWTMEPASDAIEDVHAAATVEPFLRKIVAFTSSRRHLAKMAFWGRSHAWIEGRRNWDVAGVSAKFPSGLLAEWWSPVYVRPLDKRQVIYQPKSEPVVDEAGVPRDRISVTTLLGTIDCGRHEPMKHPECLVTCRYDDEVERLGHGRGLDETLALTLWAIGQLRRLGLSGLEKWAHGIVCAKLDSTARAGTDQTAEELASATLDAIHALRADGALVVDSKDEIDVLVNNGTGGELLLKWIEFFYDGATMLVLGSIRPTGGGEGGSYDRAETESDTTDDLLDCDREMIDEEITRSVVKLWWELNAGNLASLGLATAKMPRFKSLGIDREDSEKVGRVLKQAQELGMEIGADDAHRRMGVPRPSPGEAILEAPAPPSPFGAGGDGFPKFGEDDGPDRDGPRSKFGALVARLAALWRRAA